MSDNEDQQVAAAVPEEEQKVDNLQDAIKSVI